MNKSISLQTNGQGLYEITDEVIALVSESKTIDGLCTVFVQHTSASLIIQENADSSARRDLEGWLNAFINQIDFDFTHTAEGSDDMPSHIKAALTAVSLSIPIAHGRMQLGTWQGIYLWEHRRGRHARSVVVNVR
jgi:secondary thiamine-phosphate synthase enzyme